MCVQILTTTENILDFYSREKREKQVEKDYEHNWMNNPRVNNPRNKQGTEKEKWGNGSKEISSKL